MGNLDEGWSCYDIALMSGVIARCLGCDVDLVSGKATYVSGPSGALSPLGLEQDPHCWIHVHGHGHVDLSPKLAESSHIPCHLDAVLAVSSPLVRSLHRVERLAGTGWHCKHLRSSRVPWPTSIDALRRRLCRHSHPQRLKGNLARYSLLVVLGSTTSPVLSTILESDAHGDASRRPATPSLHAAGRVLSVRLLGHAAGLRKRSALADCFCGHKTGSADCC